MQRFFEALLRKSYWIMDRLKGGQILNSLSEVMTLIESGNTGSSISRKNELLQNILAHAASSTIFYSGFTNFKSLSDFPVINKTIIRGSFDQFCSDRYTPSERISVVTSGSTGTPFKIYQNKNKKIRNYADTIYFARLSGFEIGCKLLYLKIWATQKMRGRLAYWMQNIVPVDVIHLNDRQIDELINKMESTGSAYGILGYASALELMCRYLDRKNHGPVRAKVKSIIAMSEALNEYTKSSLKKYFGVVAVSRYSNLENGIIAQQLTDGSDRFLINTASYHVEILKMDSDEEAKEDETGRIVVTDLFNYAMPLIRYDTGDIGAMISDPGVPAIKYFTRVEGRKLDLLYDTKGALVSSYIMYKNMWQYTEIKQYQLIQEGVKDYRFIINADQDFSRESQLVEEFKSYLGDDAGFVVEYVDEIPLLSSGKRRKVVNNYYV